MSLVVLAIGAATLRDVCETALTKQGHLTLALSRPLELLHLRAQVTIDALCVDGTPLGLETLVIVQGGLAGAVPVVGLDVEGPCVTSTLTLPLRADELTTAIAAAVSNKLVVRPTAPALPRLSFDPVRRTVSTPESTVALTRTEYRLLEYLQSRAEHDVTLDELLHGVWGSSEGIGTAALIRSHIRNLRLKLSRLGAGDVIRVRRGRGYAYVG